MIERITPDGERKQIYLNRPQLKAYLVQANQEYHVLGRGTGKSSEILSWKARNCLFSMPRTCGFNIGETYQQLLTKTLPALIAGWERQGFVRDVHYVVGRRPPAKWNWPAPKEAPLDPSHFIHCINGSGIHLISQDKKTSNPGLNTAWGQGDEAKFLDWERFGEEMGPTMRLEYARYGHLSTWGSLCFTTSMPTAPEARWILKKQEEMDEEQVQLILMFALQRESLMGALQQSISTTQEKKLRREIARLDTRLNELRKDAIFYQEASSFENLAILGERYFRNMKKVLPDFIFRTEILNERPKKIQGSFYPDLDYAKHTYSAYDNDYLEGLNYEMEKVRNVDCRMDADLNPELPLLMSLDWGDAINCASIAQHEENTLRFVKAMHVKQPEFLDHLAKDFCAYYRHHKRKQVHLAYGHDGSVGMANSDKTYVEQFAAILRKHGWRVVVPTIRKAPEHQETYYLWHKILSGKDPNLPRVIFNRHNCEHLLISMSQAPTRESSKGLIKKNKDSEKGRNREKVPQEEATHYSDTADMLVNSFLGHLLRGNREFVDVMM